MLRGRAEHCIPLLHQQAALILSQALNSLGGFHLDAGELEAAREAR